MTGRTSQRAYLDLQKLAREQGRNTQQLFELYIHERFLARLAGSRFADELVLKGGMLLAVLDVRRATRDADMLVRGVAGDEGSLRSARSLRFLLPTVLSSTPRRSRSPRSAKEPATREGACRFRQALLAPSSSSGSICPSATPSNRSRSITRRCWATRASRSSATRLRP